MDEKSTIKRRNLKKMKGKVIYKFPSSKCFPKRGKHAIEPGVCLTESALETDYCYHLEHEPHVIAYESQPLGFYYQINGEQRVYTPDFRVLRSDQSQQYFEIKTEEFLDKNFSEEFEAKKKSALQLGMALHLVTEQFIHREPYFTNITSLFRARTFGQVDEQTLVKVRNLFGVRTKIKASELIDFFGEHEGLNILYRLINQYEIRVDLEQEQIGLDCVLYKEAKPCLSQSE